MGEEDGKGLEEDDRLGGELRIVKDIGKEWKIGMEEWERNIGGREEYSIIYNNSICICIII